MDDSDDSLSSLFSDLSEYSEYQPSAVSSLSNLDTGSDEEYCPNPKKKKKNLNVGNQKKIRHTTDNQSLKAYSKTTTNLKKQSSSHIRNTEHLPKIVNVYSTSSTKDNSENCSSSEDDPEPLFLPEEHTLSNSESSDTISYQVPEEKEEECMSGIKVQYTTTTNLSFCRLVSVRSLKGDTQKELARKLLLNKGSSVNMESKPSTSGNVERKPSTSSKVEFKPRLLSVKTVNTGKNIKRK